MKALEENPDLLIPIYTELVPVGNPSPDVKIDWTDENVDPSVKFFYFVKAVDLEGNESLPSKIVSAKAFDETKPPPPPITSLEWVLIDENNQIFPYGPEIPPGEIRRPAVQIEWGLGDPLLSSLIQVRIGSNTTFEKFSNWLPAGETQFVKLSEYDFVDLEFRIKVRNPSGNFNSNYSTLILNSPLGGP